MNKAYRENIVINVLLIPVLFGAIEGWEHYRQDNTNVITDKTQDVLIVPIVQRSLCYLEIHSQVKSHDNVIYTARKTTNLLAVNRKLHVYFLWNEICVITEHYHLILFIENYGLTLNS